MAIKTFTSGEVLTAADTNTYLANSGLVYITSGTVTTGGNLSITGCFSSTYDSYRVVVSNFALSTAGDLEVRLSVGGSVTSAGYYWSCPLNAYANTSTYDGRGASNSATWVPLAVASTSASGSAFEVYNPAITTTTTIIGTRTDPRTSGLVGSFIGFLNNSTAYDGIYFSCSAGSFVNMRVRIYGYRQA